jgi:hypothetical protein
MLPTYFSFVLHMIFDIAILVTIYVGIAWHGRLFVVLVLG